MTTYKQSRLCPIEAKLVQMKANKRKIESEKENLKKIWINKRKG